MELTQPAKQIWSLIQAADSILLHLHPGPDPDSVGSSLAMYHILSAAGKKVTLIKGDSDLPADFSLLPGFEHIVKNNFFELDLDAYDLFLILDSASLGMVSKVAEVSFPEKLKTVVIDHHISNRGFGDINLIDSSAPATAAVLYNLFTIWPVEITPSVALCLFVGLYGDTGGFRHPGTTEQTFLIAAKLVAICPDFPKVLSELGAQNTPGQIKFRSLAYSLVEVLGIGRVALIAVDHKQLLNNNLTRDDAENQELPNNLISVKDWLIGISLLEKEPNETYISFRSRAADSYNVSKVAERIGGGGHPPAAGALFRGSATEAKRVVEQALRDVYPDLF